MEKRRVKTGQDGKKMEKRRKTDGKQIDGPAPVCFLSEIELREGEMVTIKPNGQRKLTGIIRSRLSEIEEKLRSGWTLETARAALEAELGMPVKFNTFRWAIYQARKTHTENWIAQSTEQASSPAAQTEPTTTQPIRESPAPDPVPKPKEIEAKNERPAETAEEKKRALAEATRAPIPNLDKYLPKPGRGNR